MTGFIRYRLSFGEQRHNTTQRTWFGVFTCLYLASYLALRLVRAPRLSASTTSLWPPNAREFKTPFPRDSHCGLFASRRRVELSFLTFPFPSVATRPGGLSHCYGEFNVPMEAGCFVQVLPTINPPLFLTWHQSVLNRNIHHEGICFPIDGGIYD